MKNTFRKHRCNENLFRCKILLSRMFFVLIACNHVPLAVGEVAKVIWQSEVGQEAYLSPPAMSEDGVVYAIATSGKVSAFGQAGRVKWSVKVGNILRYPSIVTKAGQVYVEAFNNALISIDYDGHIRWTLPSVDSCAFSPAVSSAGNIYCCIDTFSAIDLTGNVKWQSPSLGTSAVLDEHGNIYVTELGRLVSYKQERTLNWQITLGGLVRDSPAVSRNGMVYAVTTYAAKSENSISAVDSQGLVKWKYMTNEMMHSSPVIDEVGNLYVGDDTGAVYAVTPDGRSLWIFMADSGVSASMIVGQKNIYCVSTQGILYALNRDGTKQWQQELDGIVLGAPLLTEEGIMIIPTSKRLWAVQIEDRPAQSCWPMYRRNAGRTGSLY